MSNPRKTISTKTSPKKVDNEHNSANLNHVNDHQVKLPAEEKKPPTLDFPEGFSAEDIRLEVQRRLRFYQLPADEVVVTTNAEIASEVTTSDLPSSGDQTSGQESTVSSTLKSEASELSSEEEELDEGDEVKPDVDVVTDENDRQEGSSTNLWSDEMEEMDNVVSDDYGRQEGSSTNLWSDEMEEKDHKREAEIVSEEKRRRDSANMNLWSVNDVKIASELRRNAAAQRQATQARQSGQATNAAPGSHPGQTGFSLVAPKILPTATLKGPGGINIMSVLSLAPHTTEVTLSVASNTFRVKCDERVAPVAKYLLEQMIITERSLKESNIYAVLETRNIRFFSTLVSAQVGRQFAEAGLFGMRFEQCSRRPGHSGATLYKLALYKPPPNATVVSCPHPSNLGTRRRGDFYAPTEYAAMRNIFIDAALNGLKGMRTSNYTANSLKVVFDLGEASYLLPHHRTVMPTIKSINTDPALRNCDHLRIGHNLDVKQRFSDLNPEIAGAIINSVQRKDTKLAQSELVCHLYNPQHGTVQCVFEMLPHTATTQSNIMQLRLSDVIKTTLTTHETIFVCNANPLNSGRTSTGFPVDYRWRLQLNVTVSPEIRRAVSTYVSNWSWSPEEGILADKHLPDNGWSFKHVPKVPSFTVTRKLAYVLSDAQVSGSSYDASQYPTIQVERRTIYYPPPAAFVHLFETKRIAHPSVFRLRDCTSVSITHITGTIFAWDKENDCNDVVVDVAVWNEDLRRAEELCEILVKG